MLWTWGIDTFFFYFYFFINKSLGGLGIGYPTKVRTQPPCLKSTYKRLTRLPINRVLISATGIKLTFLLDTNPFLTQLIILIIILLFNHLLTFSNTLKTSKYHLLLLHFLTYIIAQLPFPLWINVSQLNYNGNIQHRTP